MKIPLSKIDIPKDTFDVINSVLTEGKFILGDKTEEFEEKFAKFCDSKHAACVSSGTAALFLSLQALGISKGDEVIIPSLSFVATATPILMHNAIPRFAEVNKKNYTIDPKEIEKQITKKTKGIIPVHLYGHSANMDEILEIAKENSLFVLEDSAQAHGARYKGKMIGSIGDASCFSFYPSKNLTVCGDGGIVVSNNEEIIKKIKVLRDHGREEKYKHKTLGYNLRFNEIQAAIGLEQLKNLDKYNNARRKVAKLYNEMITKLVTKPFEERWATHVYHMYTIRSKLRDKLKKFLESREIGTGIHYPIPIHKQPLINSKQRLDITEEICSTTLSLPMFPSLSTKEQDYVIKTVNQFFEENKNG